MDNKHKVEKVLENIRVRDLSVEEKENAWHGVVSKIAEMPAPQNWSLNKSIKKTMLSIIAVIAVLVLGVSGTVAASNSAKPGDTLFGIDRAVEDIRINIASDDKKNDLRIAFAEERVREFENIVKTEDDGSTDDSEGRSKRVAVGIEAATSFLEAVSAQIALSADTEKAARIEALIKQLSDELGSLSGEIKIELQNEESFRVRFQDNNSGSGNSEDNDRGRIEVRSDDGKLKIEMKDGELRIKGDLFDDNDDDSDDDDSNSTSSDSSAGGFEAEADVFTDKTVVKVEINDTKTIFTTLSKTRDAVVADILAKFPSLSKAQVEATLEIEIENRASEADDISNEDSDDDSDNDDSNDDSDDDNSGSDDDDDDSDDDNSGSGSSGSDD